MFIICDSNNVVQDIATEKANLSRGYGRPDYKLYKNIKIGDIRIGDTFDGLIMTPNLAMRIAESQQQQTQVLINQKTRELSIAALKAEGKLPADY